MSKNESLNRVAEYLQDRDICCEVRGGMVVIYLTTYTRDGREEEWTYFIRNLADAKTFLRREWGA